ncbi:ubiquitin domain containing protein [Gigaspora margarita]|uniref:Ubiquitin domain containing protein n=1 Tax=Gigaspora margarita TaxID=4874 RepID=A0A8H4ABI9_GIGMA|nr:ubiquitin domain containing protein [Gigaspora margarita]
MSNNVRCDDEEQNTSSFFSYASSVPIGGAIIFGGPFGTTAPDPSDSKKKTIREWSSSAPEWRIAARGLSLEAHCYNSSCQAYNGGYILAKWGYRDFDFFDDSDVKCPMCGQYVQPKNFGFYDTWYKVVGSKKDRLNGPSQKVDTVWDYAPTQHYTTFLDSPEDLVYWGRLEIKVSKSKPY